MNRTELENKERACREMPMGTPERAREQAECSCIEMINSILCYSCEGYKDSEAVLEYEENSYHNYLEKYVEELGRKRVLELIQGQIDSIVSVQRNVFTDDEGLSYNSLVFA